VRILLPTLYATRGGSTRILLAAAEALRPEHEVVVRAPLAEADDPAPPAFPARPLAGPWRKAATLPLLARLLVRESAALRRLRPDLVYVHDEPSLHVYGLAARTLRPRPPILWHLHLDPARGRAARLRAALADACIRISPHLPPPPGLPCTLIRNPLPLDIKGGEVPPDPLANLGVVGAIYPQKGQDLAVEALAILRRRPGGAGARLTLIGPEFDPPFATALRRRIEELGLGEAVAFAGERSAQDAFSGVGLALFPSQSEVQPLALAEALARDLPVVASDIPAHRAMFEDAGIDPARLAARDPQAFATAILSAADRQVDPTIAPRIRALHAPDAFAGALRATVRLMDLQVRSRTPP
jgi:glycosyltransferase involved in cell wall biosynthesis